MESFISKIFFGNCGMSEERYDLEEYKKYIDISIDCEQKLKAQIEKSPELLDLLIKCLDNYTYASAENCKSYYSNGFKFGFMLALEVTGALKTE